MSSCLSLIPLYKGFARLQLFHRILQYFAGHLHYSQPITTRSSLLLSSSSITTTSYSRLCEHLQQTLITITQQSTADQLSLLQWIPYAYTGMKNNHKESSEYWVGSERGIHSSHRLILPTSSFISFKIHLRSHLNLCLSR